MKPQSFTLLLVSIAAQFCAAQAVLPAKKIAAAKKEIISSVDLRYNQYRDIALNIWQFAEVGYQEYKSSALLQETLKNAGFTVQNGVAGIPTAFVATAGSGKPVIGILAEFDALPGLSQQAVPEKRPMPGLDAGHACGHHLFGTASVAAAIALKEQMEKNGLKGTVKIFGTPAEEGGGGKVYMVREGLFNDVDAVLHWHPGSRNAANPSGSLANISAKFRFYGLSAHAAGAPERGRSALDAVEAMNYMVNLMREHIPSDTRIHYVITDGGKAPNVVPDYAEVYYYARHPKRDVLAGIFERIKKVAEGAALGTETRMEFEIINGVYDLLPNEPLARLMYANLVQVGGVHYTPEEVEFGKKIQQTLIGNSPEIATAAKIDSFNPAAQGSGGSTDVGDISYVVPTAGLVTATWIPGVPAHSWQAVACGGTDIGVKGMLVAAKTLALTALDLFNDPAYLQQAREDYRRRLGPDFKYQALIGDRKPPLDYRK